MGTCAGWHGKSWGVRALPVSLPPNPPKKNFSLLLCPARIRFLIALLTLRLISTSTPTITTHPLTPSQTQLQSQNSAMTRLTVNSDLREEKKSIGRLSNHIRPPPLPGHYPCFTLGRYPVPPWALGRTTQQATSASRSA